MTRAIRSFPMPAVSSDQPTRVEALDPARSFIVQAPAGSGKTELLIQRFLALLARVELPEAIIALTFTRKAAAEMRYRILGALEAAGGPEPDLAHERETWLLARAALARNDAFEWNLLDHPARLRIQTIDSLCAGLVRQMPWISRMGAPREPDENIGQLYRLAARRTLNHLDSNGPRSASVRSVLGHLDNNVAVAERLLAGMLARRDQWLRHVVGTEASGALRRKFEAVLGEIIHDELGMLARAFPDDDLVATVDCARFAAMNLVEQGADSPLTACVDLEGLPDTDVDGLSAWLGLGELFLTRDGKLRRSLNVRQGFPPTAEGKSFKARMADVHLGPTVIDLLNRVRSLPPPAHTDSQWATLSSLLDLLPLAVAELKVVFRAEGRVDFTEIALAARTALGPADAPTGLAFAMDCRIQHLLVDEFQDISQSQFELLESLTADWQGDDGRTLFVVGDPMQSIYSFREADVALFLRARQEGLGGIGLTSLTLSTNFRSSPGIVDWINAAMAPAFPATEEMLTGAVPYVNSDAFDVAADVDVGHTDEPGPAVSVHPFLDDDPEEEAAEIVDVVNAAWRRDSNATVAVLVRARRHLEHAVRAFRREGIPFQAVEIDGLKSRSVVQDLGALMRALTDPSDRVAWLAVLRAPWCGLTLTDLERLIDGDMHSTVWDLIGAHADRSGERPFPPLSEDGSRRLERVERVLADALRLRGAVPLRRWVEGTWLALGGPACLEHPSDLGDAHSYLDLVSEAAPGAAIRDEARFADAVERLFAESTIDPENGRRGGVVQLLTIHKAKGLEFDTVILPGLGRVTEANRPHLMTWLEYIDREGASRLLLAPISESGAGEDQLANYLRRLETLRREHESTRLMYVATTRARKNLHLLGHVRVDRSKGRIWPPDSRSLLARVWSEVEPAFTRSLEEERGRAPVRADEKLSTQGVPLRRLSLGWKMPDPGLDPWRATTWDLSASDDPKHHPSFEWASDLQRRVGIVVHGLLQRMAPVRGGDGFVLPGEATIRAALASEGVGGTKLDVALARVGEAIRNAITDPRGLWILRAHGDDHREYPLTRVRGVEVRRYVLDRTFVDEGVRWIIDYKTGTHEGAGIDAFLDNEQARYRPQLEEYARAMRSLDSRPIRLGLYFPLLSGWREWSFGEGPGSNVATGEQRMVEDTF